MMACAAPRGPRVAVEDKNIARGSVSGATITGTPPRPHDAAPPGSARSCTRARSASRSPRAPLPPRVPSAALPRRATPSRGAPHARSSIARGFPRTRSAEPDPPAEGRTRRRTRGRLAAPRAVAPTRIMPSARRSSAHGAQPGSARSQGGAGNLSAQFSINDLLLKEMLGQSGDALAGGPSYTVNEFATLMKDQILSQYEQRLSRQLSLRGPNAANAAADATAASPRSSARARRGAVAENTSSGSGKTMDQIWKDINGPSASGPAGPARTVSGASVVAWHNQYKIKTLQHIIEQYWVHVIQ